MSGMTRLQKEQALKDLQDLLDRLTSETMSKARELGALQERVNVLNDDLEENWEAIQEIRKTLQNQDTFLTPIPISKDKK